MKVISMNGVVGMDILVEDIQEQIQGADSLKIELNSGGGSVLEGYAIYNALKKFAGNIEMNVTFGASIASLIMLAGDHITMEKNTSLIMIHEPWAMQVGTSTEMRRTADALDTIRDQILNIYSEHTGIDQTTILEMLKSETWMTAQEAMDAGFIHEITGGKSDKNAMIRNAIAANESEVSFSLCAMMNKIDSLEQETAEKVEINSLRDAEKHLRTAGFSKKDAVAFVSQLKSIVKNGKVEESSVDYASILREFASKFDK